MALLPVEDALKRLLGDAEPLTDVDMVPLPAAGGRVLAEDLTARRTQPPFPASAMDGYAVRHADIARIPAELTVIGQSAAGHGFSGRVGDGEAVRIFTGAPLPDGADTVVIQENVETTTGNRISIVETTSPGRHIRQPGLDFSEGETLLRAGNRLDAGRLMLAAGMNHAVLPVRRKPVIAVLATGDELVAPGETPGADQIVASNSFGIGALVAEAGGTVLELGIVDDDLADIQAAMDRAVEGSADILVTLGGASVGDHDLVQAALTGRGMTLDFWKIAMRPGKPLMFGRIGAMRILGLPGNPVSSLVCGNLFLVPLVRRLAGLPENGHIASAILGAALEENDHRQDYLRAHLVRRPDGQLEATAFDRQDSSMMRTFAGSECLIIRPPYAPAARPGDPCRINVLRWPD